MIQVAPLAWCKGPDVGIPRPDLVIYLKLEAKAAERRDVYGEERYEKVSFQQQVEEQFEALKEEDWMLMDASRDIVSLHTEILAKALEVIDKCGDSGIDSLWTNDLKL